ncbi:unnamed protein product [Cylindrotheca closterium]|uniref:Tyrosine specific protein phosphatases domain-containing protein n=1 Tax=Cylindrotheca closterium TaxID=2856 RepID=A0AAD2JLF2_9STRA|nr:unnamed protein product [Cylindrotheca closterium]
MMSRSLRWFFSVTLSLASHRQGGPTSSLAAAWRHPPASTFISSRKITQYHRSLVSISLLSLAQVASRIHHRDLAISLFHHRDTNHDYGGGGGGDSNHTDDKNNILQNKQKLVGPLIQPPRPNGNTYWVIPNAFLAGEYPGAATPEASQQKLRAYLDLGVTCFFDLTFPGEKPEYESILKEEAALRNRQHNSSRPVEYHRYSIPDFGIPSNPNLMKELLEDMNQAMNERNQTIYVHCRGGIGRTGTTVGCFLKQYGNYDNGDEALQELNRLFQTSGRSLESSFSPETPDQIRFIKEWNSK